MPLPSRNPSAGFRARCLGRQDSFTTCRQGHADDKTGILNLSSHSPCFNSDLPSPGEGMRCLASTLARTYHTDSLDRGLHTDPSASSVGLAGCPVQTLYSAHFWAGLQGAKTRNYVCEKSDAMRTQEEMHTADAEHKTGTSLKRYKAYATMCDTDVNAKCSRCSATDDRDRRTTAVAVTNGGHVLHRDYVPPFSLVPLSRHEDL